MNIFIATYNALVDLIEQTGDQITDDEYTQAKDFHTKARDKVIQLFTKLSIKIRVPTNLPIDPSDIETDPNLDSDNETMTDEEFLSLCAKVLNKTYSGDPLGLKSFQNSVNLLKSMVGNHGPLLLSFVQTRLDGKALEAVDENPVSIDALLHSLAANIKPEPSKVIASRLLSLKFDRSKSQEFSKQSEELGEAFQRALVIEGVSRQKAQEMTIDKTIEVCRSSTRSDLVKAVLSATTYSDPKEVVAKLVLESSVEVNEKQILTYNTQRFNNRRNNNSQNRRFQGRGRNANNGRNNYNNNNSFGNNSNQWSNNQNNNYRGRGNQSRRYNSNNNRSVRAIEASENPTAPQQYQLGAIQNHTPQ